MESGRVAAGRVFGYTIGMGTALRVLLLALAASAAAPPAAQRLKTEDPARGHRYFGGTGRLIYVEGEYPSKTRLGVYDVAAKKSRSFFFPEQRLTGRFVYLEDRDQALVESLDRPGTADEPGLLRVDLKSGAVLGRIPLTGEVGLAGFALPAWSREAFLVLTARDRTFLKTLDPATGEAREARPLGDFTTLSAAFDETGPWALLTAKEKGRARLVVVDLSAGKVLRDFPSETGFDGVTAGPGGLLAHARAPGDAVTVFSRLDPAGGTAREVGRVDGEVETVLEAGGRVYAVLRDPARPPSDAEKDLRPRVLAVFDARRPGPPETLPWTQRRGTLVGFASGTGRLYYSATQPSSSWELPADAAGLADAARELDRRTGEFWGADRQSWFLGLLAAGVLLGIVMAILMRPACKTCG